MRIRLPVEFLVALIVVVTGALALVVYWPALPFAQGRALPSPIVRLVTATPVPPTSTPPTVIAARPEYVKDLVAYQEGPDGLVVYFVLADRDGQEIAAPGKMRLTLCCSPFVDDTGAPIPAYVDGWWFARPEDFFVTTIGLGSFARDRLIYAYDRITYQMIDSYMLQRGMEWRFYKRSEHLKKATLEFKTEDDRGLKASTTYYLGD